MIDALEPLTGFPGVRLVALVTEDGVPIAAPGREIDAEGNEVGDRSRSNEEALAALTTGWVGEISWAVASMSWEPPVRVVLRAARGTLLMRRARGAWIVVVIAAGLRSEDVMLSMDGTAARIERMLRGMGGEKSHGGAPAAEPPAPLPSARAAEDSLNPGREQENPTGM